MTETQRKFLTEYLGQCWHEIEKACFGNVCKHCGQSFVTVFINRAFTELKDKQDLLERVIEKGEWMEFLSELNDIWKENLHFPEFSAWLIQLSPLKTAELICRWKGVE